MLPFIAIEDQQYPTYLGGVINFSSGCPVIFLVSKPILAFSK